MLKKIIVQTDKNVLHSTGWVVTATTIVAKDVLTVDEILDTVMNEFEVSIDMLKVYTKNTLISDIRKVYSYFACNLTTESLETIAKRINKHHTSIMSAHRKANELLSVNDDIMVDMINKVATRLKQLQHEKVQN